jgi:Predicted transcriptional regulators
MGRDTVDEEVELLKALAHPLRYTIVLELCEGGRTVSEIADRLGLRSCIVSQQLRILRACGIANGAREGGFVRYTLIEKRAMGIVRALSRPPRAVPKAGSARRREH